MAVTRSGGSNTFMNGGELVDPLSEVDAQLLADPSRDPVVTDGDNHIMDDSRVDPRYHPVMRLNVKGRRQPALFS